ncbi:MAG: hypothetical protein ACK40M_04340 [Flavobacteriales bacterium]
MAVSLVPKFSKEQIKREVRAWKKRVENALILNMKAAGEQFIISVRNNNTYQDRTGNLRSSTGYIIMKDGRQLFQDYETLPGPDGSGKEGTRAAKRVIREASKRFPRGFVLIGVAGMDYAAAVEAKGFDVISNGAIEAEAALKAAVRRLTKKA